MSLNLELGVKRDKKAWKPTLRSHIIYANILSLKIGRGVY
jgi:hypothetical protein